jgi:hypothetical protein
MMVWYPYLPAEIPCDYLFHADGADTCMPNAAAELCVERQGETSQPFNLLVRALGCCLPDSIPYGTRPAVAAHERTGRRLVPDEAPARRGSHAWRMDTVKKRRKDSVSHAFGPTVPLRGAWEPSEKRSLRARTQGFRPCKRMDSGTLACQNHGSHA